MDPYLAQQIATMAREEYRKIFIEMASALGASEQQSGRGRRGSNVVVLLEMLAGLQRQGNDELRSLLQYTLYIDRSFHFIHQALYYRQSESGSAVAAIGCSIDLLEGAVELLISVRIDTDAGIRDLQHDASLLVFGR
jgi:hypothetical protein